ncbi:hypothetical protein F4604DRAFT_1687768 [Suillus subluteus]|nr:hypothetical protein F4604DRAFT_1687768 [Suillus subluteus]
MCRIHVRLPKETILYTALRVELALLVRSFCMSPLSVKIASYIIDVREKVLQEINHQERKGTLHNKNLPGPSERIIDTLTGINDNHHHFMHDIDYPVHESKPVSSIIQVVLLKQRLSLDDPSYALLYFRALKIDSSIVNVFPKPLVSDNEWDTSHHEVYFIPTIVSDLESEKEYLTYPAERTIKDKSGKRHEVFDGIYPPPAKEYPESLKREQRQHSDVQDNKENIPVSARRTFGPLTRSQTKRLADDNINSTSKIEEIVEEEKVILTNPLGGRTQVHEVIQTNEPIRVWPGSGAPPSREFISMEVKRVYEKKYVSTAPPRDTRPIPFTNQQSHFNVDDNEDIVMDDSPAIKVKEKMKVNKGDANTIMKVSDEKSKALAPIIN